jgi:hypothetical protein
MYLEMEREIQSIGLSVNQRKTKYMIVSASEVRRGPQNLLVGEKNFESVPSFTYLGALINSRNHMGQSIRERIQAGNWEYCANLDLFKNQLISRSTKLKIYITLVHLVVTYGGETWLLTVADENVLRSFEGRILRKSLDLYGIEVNHDDFAGGVFSTAIFY